MALSVNINPIALDELSQVVSYLHEHASARTAERFVDIVRKSLIDLAKMPDLGAEVSFRRSALSGIRCWPLKKPFKKYLIYYRVDGRKLDIIHVLHGSRDTESILTG